MKNDILETVKRKEEKGKASLADLSIQLTSLAEASKHQKIVCIIDSLDFETRQSRQSDISDTEYQTFQWVFNDRHGPTDQHVGLRNWLQHGDDIYWISGKAGSGKSVLMNYIANEPLTQQLLQSWAGDTRLIIAKYFFWNAGAQMQKSQQGLLQSLLREVYGQCPELVPLICPSRWIRYHEIGATWSRLEIQEAFKRLSQQQSLNLKFCFFVDGLDEYDGEDYTHIIKVLKDLNASPSVKICLSSRPWNIFIAAFGTSTDQRLVLEDHNGDDIEKFVRSRFASDEHFKLLQSRDSRSSDLVDQIVRNAQGVFLWVRIVVGNLLRAMSNDDSLSDLHKRLESFPTTLTAYFQHMFDSIDDFYREETSEILLICLEGMQPLSLLALWFYEQEKVTLNYTLRADITPLGRRDVVAIFEGIHKRINARGQDLLVIEDNSLAKYEQLMYTVRFSHRTVKDFLLKPDMLKKLNSWKSKDFDARNFLCKATLATVKSLPSPTDKTIYVNDNRCWYYVNEFFFYARLIENDESSLDFALMDEFQRAVSSYRFHKRDERGTYLERFFTSLVWVFDYGARWVAENDILSIHDDPNKFLSPYDKDMTRFFFALAVEGNLKGYIQHKLATMPQLIKRSFCQRPLLDRALRPSPSARRTFRIDPDMINVLLTRGANPNEVLTLYKLENAWDDLSWTYAPEKAWTTVWALFLRDLHEAKSKKIRKSPELVQDELEVTKLMIENGAAMDLRPWRILALQHPLKPFGGPTLTPSEVLHEVFPQRDAEFLDQLLRKNRPWALWQACLWVKRTVLLWIYRDIHIVVWSLSSLYAIFFNQTLGVILPMVVIPTVLYGLWLVCPIFSFVISRIAPVLLPALILSDWIRILDWLIWFNSLLVLRNSALELHGLRRKTET